MASRLGRPPRTPKPQTPDPIPAHKFLKRMSTQDMTASMRAYEEGDGEVERGNEIEKELSDSEWEIDADESKGFFEAMVKHQYSDEEDPFEEEEIKNETKKESLIDDEGFPLITSPSHSPTRKKKLNRGGSSTENTSELPSPNKKSNKAKKAISFAEEDEPISKTAKINETIERYVISCRDEIKPAREVGKTIGVPYVGAVVGSKPVRTHTTRHADSAIHVQYTKILTAADPPGTAPYSWVKIGADRRDEITRVKNQRQTPHYKTQKRNAQIYNKSYAKRGALKHLPPRRFWDEWKTEVRF